MELNENKICEKKIDEQKESAKDIISNLTNKIVLLEQTNNELRKKNEVLIKNNIKTNELKLKSSIIGMRWNLASKLILNNVKNDSNKLTEIIKEKEDLQEMNEKMLNLLTEKEIENEDLLEKLENYQLNTKLELEKNEEKIKNLQEKINLLENTKESNLKDLDDIISEYTNFQDKLKSQIKELSQKEEELLSQNESKEIMIEKLTEEIQELKLNNYHLKSQSEKLNEINEIEYDEKEKVISENIKIKKENENLNEKMMLAAEGIKNTNKFEEVIGIKEEVREDIDGLMRDNNQKYILFHGFTDRIK